MHTQTGSANVKREYSLNGDVEPNVTCEQNKALYIAIGSLCVMV